MDESERHWFRLVASACVFYVLGTLVQQFSEHQFQQYVRTFYPKGFPNAAAMQALTNIADVLQPPCWYSPSFGVLYVSIRFPCKPSSTKSPFVYGFLGSLVGWATTAYVMPSPGPNHYDHSYKVPFFCLVGTILGATIWKANQSTDEVNQTVANEKHNSGDRSEVSQQ